MEEQQKPQVVVIKPNLGYMIAVGVLSAIATSYVLKFAKSSNIPILSGPDEDDDE